LILAQANWLATLKLLAARTASSSLQFQLRAIPSLFNQSPGADTSALCEIGGMNIKSVFLVDLRDIFTQLGMKRTFISLLLVAFAAHIIYYVTKRYLEHRVSGGSLNKSARIVRANKLQADATFGRRHRCQLPPELPYRWPLGLDRIKELWDSNSEGCLLAFLCLIAKDYEPRNNLS
jgi:hypothetical protein